MTPAHGQFVWSELLTNDVGAATRFYQSAIGWAVTDAGLADRDYLTLRAGTTPVGGLMPLPATFSDATPHWLDHIAVDDVDAAAARVTAIGGRLHRAPDDVPEVGRFAVVADPQGASFVLFRSFGMDHPSQAAPGTPGHVGWHELMADDWEAAFAFYADLFDWTKAEAIDMGPMGTYQLFAAGSVPIGGMMNRGESGPPVSWNRYFNVDDINAGVRRVQTAGGRILSGPHEVPGGSRVARACDPQGGHFAMVAR